MKSNSIISFIVLIAAMLFMADCSQNRSKADKSAQDQANQKITFIELGSVRCIPCQKMQVVMKSIEAKYGDQVNIIFYDVWTEKGKPLADQYGINLIPTQVFLDQNGVEYFRHEGFFPEEEVVKILNEKGVK
jgi:thioredoxin 1